MAATCGHCRKEKVTVAHVRACYGVEIRSEEEGGFGSEVAHEARRVPDPSRPSSFAGLIPDGVYAVTIQGELGFYKVSSPTSGRWAGYVFVNRKRGEKFVKMDSIHAQGRVLAGILSDGVQTAMERYGVQTGRCGHCGRALTNPESIKRGIGPICAGKMGF